MTRGPGNDHFAGRISHVAGRIRVVRLEIRKPRTGQLHRPARKAVGLLCQVPSPGPGTPRGPDPAFRRQLGFPYGGDWDTASNWLDVQGVARLPGPGDDLGNQSSRDHRHP